MFSSCELVSVAQLHFLLIYWMKSISPKLSSLQMGHNYSTATLAFVHFRGVTKNCEISVKATKYLKRAVPTHVYCCSPLFYINVLRLECELNLFLLICECTTSIPSKNSAKQKIVDTIIEDKHETNTEHISLATELVHYSETLAERVIFI